MEASLSLIAAPSTRSSEFRRGWKVLAGCILGVAVGGPSLFYLPAGVLMKPIAADLKVTRTALSGGLLVFTVIIAIASPFVGGVIDRFGVRRLIFCSLAALGCCYLGFAFLLRSELGFYILSAFCALAGAGSTALSFTRAVTDWFKQARGLAIGLMLMGTGLTVMLVPLALTEVMTAYTWRGGYLALAALVFVALPIVALLVKLDDSQPDAAKDDVKISPDGGTTLLFSRTFWVMISAFFFLSIGLSGLTVHFVPLLTDGGFSAARAASMAGLIGLSAIGGRLAAGSLVDYLFAPYVAVPIFLLSAAGCLALATFGAPVAAIAAVAIGLGAGAELELMGYLTARYFPTRLYGRAYGWQFGAFAIANGLSPLWIAIVHDNTGSYNLALYGIAAILLVPSVLFLRLPRY